MSSVTTHRCFISYHKADQAEVDAFIAKFDDEKKVFTYRAIREMDDNIVNSNDNDYIMRQIREKYLSTSTVTIVLIGQYTYGRKYVDWEIMSSLRNDPNNKRSGLLGIQLPSVSGKNILIPARLDDNIVRDSNANDIGYARYYSYPARADTLANWIEDAFQARTTRAALVNNGRARRVRNS